MRSEFRSPELGNPVTKRDAGDEFPTSSWWDMNGHPVRLFPLMSLVLFALLAGTAEAQNTLRIAAAADLQPALPQVLAIFQQQTGIHAEPTFQASAALTSQILAGAPFDLFLSADTGYPQRLIEAHLADGPAPTLYACGTLVIWTRKDSHWPAPSLATLSDPSLQRLAVANPDRAPYGRAAIATLTSLRLVDALRPKLVKAENISQTAQFAETGNADAGLISLTSALTPHLREIGNWFVVPRELYPAIEQGAVVITGSANHAQAQRFLQFLLSAPIQQQLAQSGLTPVR